MDFVNNAYCGALETGGKGYLKIEHILDITPNTITLKYIEDTKTVTKTKDNSIYFDTLNKWANVLYQVQDSGLVWNGPFSLRNGLAYSHQYSNSIKTAISKLTGQTVSFSADGGSGNIYAKGTTENAIRNSWNNLGLKDVHARIYFLKGNASQARLMFKTEEAENPKFNVNVIKKDSISQKTISGAYFDVKIENISYIDRRKYNFEINDNVATGMVSAGEINLRDIQGDGSSNPIIITIKETKAPTGYKILKETTKIYVKQDCSKYKIDEGTWTTLPGERTISIGIENQPLININGYVWQDAQKGDKLISGPNGVRDEYYIYEKVETGNGNYIAVKDDQGNITYTEVGKGQGDYIRVTITEEGLEGIDVELRTTSDGFVAADTTTDENGYYSFENIPIAQSDYKVVFIYNGIKYEDTTAGNDSKASENNTRSSLNDRFKTISYGQSNDTTPLEYDYDGENNTSTLRANNDGTNPASSDPKKQFKVEAEVNLSELGYKSDSGPQTFNNVNLGLIEKEFDLAIGTDVKEARLTINGKETTYSYAKIMNGEWEDLWLDEVLEENSSDNKDVTYNLYLYKSDYNYRIGDYKTDNSAIANTVNAADNNVNNYEEQSELEAYVTYSVYLKNQTYTDAQVDQFVYYYDEIYEPYNIVPTDEYDVVIDERERKITVTAVGDGLSVGKDNGYIKQIDLTFRVTKDEDGNVELKENCTNITEITRYSTTNGGLIDIDSAPGNGITNGAITQYEDDTDEAKGITISLKDEERTITGTVWDDGKFNNANGVKDGGENPEDGVNDVIVQLIEIKTIGGKNYEYIWQETRSGSGTVKKLSEDGQSITEYTNQYPTGEGYDGYYEFEGYIPGNYIIRFIYGDGTTYDLTGNVQTYNGQDYKSTVDDHYNAPWYNTAGYTDGESVARDNEARRLEVMAYSSTIDETIGQSLENREEGDLRNTWMAAETSRINVPVDEDKDDGKATSSNTTTVEYENINNSLSFDNMNFGLALRPETKLILEKHITGLKITPNGTGVQSIIDAKADISQIINNTGIDVSGVTEGLATIKSTRDNRGFWQVATDVEELAQGAQLEVEYTYVIRNDSDEDYLSEALVTAYTNQDIKSYSQTLGEIRDTVKTTMRSGTYSYSDSNVIGTYLGQFYYTGIRGENDTPVLSRVETIEEALNNDLKFDAKEGTSGNDFEEKVTNEDEKVKTELNADGIGENTTIETVIQNTSVTDFLTRYTGNGDEYHEAGTNEDGTKRVANADYSKTVTLRTVLTSNSNGELGGNYQSYIAEIMQYSNAAGRRNMEAEPANLSYVNSEDTNVTLDNSWIYEIENGDGTTTKHTTQNESEIPENAINVRLANEADEFWGETIIITKPTGEDRLSALAITIIVISSLAVIAVGIVLIKKFVIKK